MHEFTLKNKIQETKGGWPRIVALCTSMWRLFKALTSSRYRKKNTKKQPGTWGEEKRAFPSFLSPVSQHQGRFDSDPAVPLRIPTFCHHTVFFPSTTPCAKILANPASRVAVKSRIPLRNFAFSRIPCIPFNRNLLQDRTAFSGDSCTPGLFCLSAATLARFFCVEIFSLVDERSTKFARLIACCAWSAVKWVTLQV